MGTQELQVIEFEVMELVPAKVISNIDDLKNFMEIVKQKYKGWIVTEDDIDIAKSERTKLNKLEKKISDERKKIQKKANADIETLIDTLKTYEKEVKGISNFIGEQLKGYDEKIREEKKVEVQKKINNIFTRNPGLKIFLEWNDKWLDKSFAFKKIENEVQKQYDELEKKQDFINSQIAKANAEIQFMITFESMKFLMSEDYNTITETIESKKNEIKQTEENLRQKAEEEKQKELAELEAKKEREKEEAVKNAQIKATQQQNNENKETKKTAVNSKYYDITLRFPKAPSQFLKDFKELVDSYGLEYIKIESKQI
jgi:putative DNA double-strand break repair rad50 ATPase (fragment)